jgi:hypothetical protein
MAPEGPSDAVAPQAHKKAPQASPHDELKYMMIERHALRVWDTDAVYLARRAARRLGRHRDRFVLLCDDGDRDDDDDEDFGGLTRVEFDAADCAALRRPATGLDIESVLQLLAAAQIMADNGVVHGGVTAECCYVSCGPRRRACRLGGFGSSGQSDGDGMAPELRLLHYMADMEIVALSRDNILAAFGGRPAQQQQAMMRFLRCTAQDILRLSDEEGWWRTWDSYAIVSLLGQLAAAAPAAALLSADPRDRPATPAEYICALMRALK